MVKHTILGIHVTDRLRRAKEVQKVFTEFGCNIKTRLGLHEVTGDVCASNGLVLLELVGSAADLKKMEERLKAISGIEVKKMVFAPA